MPEKLLIRNRFDLMWSIAFFTAIYFLIPCLVWGQESRTEQLISEKTEKSKESKRI